MLGRIKPIFIKELRQIMRDKLSLGVIIFIPAFMLVMFGYALNFDVKNISLGIYDEDKSKESRDFVNKFIQSEYFTYKFIATSSKEIDENLQKGNITVGIIIPQTFSKDLTKGITSPIQLLVDGSNSNTASTVLGYANAIISNYSKDILVKEIRNKLNTGFTETIDYRPRVWYNPELKSSKFLIPGLIGFILLIASVVTTSLSIVREKERNTIEQIVVSPIKPYELIIGKTFTYILISLLITVLIFITSYLLFGLVIKGNYFMLFLSILIFLASCLGIGILVSSVAETQQVAFMLSTLISMLPSFILSGFVFPIRNMPLVIQLITYIIPVRYFLVILRSIVLKGSGITAYWSEMLALIVMAIILLGLSILRMRKKPI